ncbi:SGNH/GDSL hydrolase family protein [Mycobacterium riyadhense]|uniref:SGNH/GDSL hydrolase family protein n=1 Tax=Mycobacterium riyadhense TaxID=486698 RepID=UPI00195A3D9E|nr:SGNH/GDSL hydrolase family protein [Mycobacterium riyadhense]
MGWTRLAVASLVGAVAVGCAAFPAASPGPAKPLDYVAMGDSAAAAPGVPDQAAPRGCNKSTNNYPSVLARRIKPTRFVDVTCSGANTLDLISRQQQTQSGLIDRQLDAVAATTGLITITIGANDVGLASDAQACEVKLPNPKSCTAKFVVGDVDRISTQIAAQVPVWAMMIDQIRVKAPHARIILVGYGIVIRSGGCFPGQPVLPHDSDYLQAKLNELDNRQRQLAAAKGIDYFDTRPLSVGHDMCAPPAERYTEGFVTKAPAVPLHPTAFGAAAVGSALAEHVTRPGSRG